ncbi:MAG TPA: polyphosphate kinase 1 [Pyrinomonadaceae bacterium]|nr:polyphosphate kinase 1 [Pyrinomonadaceae bacterium]
MNTNLQINEQIGVAPNARAKLALASPLPAPEKLLFNRELSLVEFFRQVLEEGLEAENPLLERLRFLTIFSNIIDEFFMVRVSGLKEEVEHGWPHPSPDGMTADEQLREIRHRLRPMMVEQMRCLKEEILPQLAEQGIVLAPYQSLSHEQRAELDEYFQDRVLPVLTPLAVDPAHPFPYISGLSLNLAVMVESPDKVKSVDKSEARFVRLKVPPVLPGLIPIEKESKFVLLSEVIAANLGALFPGMHSGPAYAFRVTRDADIDIREDEAEDLLRALQAELRKRRFGTPVRLEVAADMPDAMLDYLTNSLGLESDDIYPIDGPLNVADLLELCELNRPNLKFRPLRTSVPEVLRAGRPIFDVIKEQDLLLHHPYIAYSTVTDFIRAAANDPDVLAIKICLYRTGQQSVIAETLIAAGEQGKQITALIELKARFDEENNIEWAQRLERAGVHVVYGFVGLKTHCKLSLVIRREGGALKRYVHIATGNYTPTSSSTYTDLGLFTADKEIGEDATEFFNYLTGYSQQQNYRRLLISPVNLREKLTSLIERETANAKAGRTSRIIAKLNRLADPNIIQLLYDASAAGVEIDLIVRGICMLRPGVPGLSQNIRVRSIIGRFLEHSRVFYFANDGNEEVYVGSADWMPRNLNRRIEVICPVNDPRLRSYLRDEVLQAYLRDNVNARELQPDGSYERVPVMAGEERFDSQMCFEGESL